MTGSRSRCLMSKTEDEHTFSHLLEYQLEFSSSLSGSKHFMLCPIDFDIWHTLKNIFPPTLIGNIPFNGFFKTFFERLLGFKPKLCLDLFRLNQVLAIMIGPIRH